MFDDNVVLCMNLICVIDEVCEVGYWFGYVLIGELMIVFDYLMIYMLLFSEESLIVCLLNVFFDWLMCMLLGYVVFCDVVVNV